VSYREIFSGLAIALTFVAYVPYIRSIQAGKTRPHLFSWVVWGLGTSIVFFAQIAGGGGVGAWPIGVTALVTLYVAWLCWVRRTDTAITPGDWLFFLAALSSLPLWYAASNPLWAVVILTSVDLLGFGPTFRKAHRDPSGENLTFFALMAIRNGLSVVALEQHNLTTMLFPVAVALACAVFIAMVLRRRRGI
jgi:hypothetical protein